MSDPGSRHQSTFSDPQPAADAQEADVMMDLLKEPSAKEKVAKKFDTTLRKKETNTIERVQMRSTLLGGMIASVLVADDIRDYDGSPSSKLGQNRAR